ncbi:MAG TPA: DUF1080 domain-containing protein [Armatimonadaceae bacterium]|nr:DUF1080 domain-containing protein [Armatimonadaceae bacterium]
MQQKRRQLIASAVCLALASAAAACGAALATAPRQEAAGAKNERGWTPLFNGKNLDGWTVKIKGYDPGDNHADTFRVEDGVLKVAYDKYPRFDGKFGHLFYKSKYASYRLRVEYRFVGEQASGGPGWALRNSGVMIHSQSPQSMRKDQDFPVSLEVQFLGGLGKGPRATGNLCTPGTVVQRDGKPVVPHCIDSRSKTYDGDQWVTAEVEVGPDGRVRHLVNGEPVLEYENPELDEKDADARALLEKGAPKALKDGYIALQAESHPVEFRRVEIRPTGG